MVLQDLAEKAHLKRHLPPSAKYFPPFADDLQSYHKVKEYFKCQNIGEVKMKNKTVPVNIYQVLE